MARKRHYAVGGFKESRTQLRCCPRVLKASFGYRKIWYTDLDASLPRTTGAVIPVLVKLTVGLAVRLVGPGAVDRIVGVDQRIKG